MGIKNPQVDIGFQSSLFRLYSSVTDEFIGVFDPVEMQFIFVNDAGAVMLGFSDAVDMLKTQGNGVIKENLISLIKIAQNQKENRVSDSQEVLFDNIGNNVFYGALQIYDFTEEHANYILVRIKNISEFRKTDHGFLQEKERFEALFNYATLGILLADKSGMIVLANNFACKQFGYENATEMQGQKVENLIPSRLKEKHVQLREGYNQNPNPRSMGSGKDLFALRKDGTEFSVEISLSHFHTEEGFFAIAFIIDISKRKEIENSVLVQQQELERINQEIEKMNDELEEKVNSRTKQLHLAMKQLEESKDELTKALSNEKELSDMKSRFVSMASHEFRTPLSTILSSASLVAKYTSGDEQDKRDKHIQRIKSSVNNLTDILNDFLSLGKMEDGKIAVNPIDINIRTLLVQLVTEMQVHAKPGQTIQFNHQGEEQILIDANLLRNAVINLLSNAIKFSPEKKSIRLSSKVENGEIVIIVEDSGIGISDEDQKHLFERFFRANNATNIQGTGLGLHIVSKYIEILGGEIEFTSELEKGSTFIIKIKL